MDECIDNDGDYEEEEEEEESGEWRSVTALMLLDACIYTLGHVEARLMIAQLDR